MSVLPYRFGTHSGWLEACRDLGTTVVAPDCGYFADQGPVLTYAMGEDRFDADSLRRRAAHGRAATRRPRRTSTRARRQRDEVAAAHLDLYRRLRTMRRLRICIIGSSRFPIREPFAGGLEAHTHALARRLSERGHEVTLFAAPGSDPTLGLEELAVEQLQASAGERSDTSYPPHWWMQEHHAYQGLMLDLMRHGHERFDVIHNNSIHHLPVAMADVLRIPMVTTLHTPPTPWLSSALAHVSPRAVFVAVSRLHGRGVARRGRQPGGPQRRRHRPVGAGSGRRSGRLERSPRAREGTAPGHRRRPAGGDAAAARGPGARRGLLRP